MVPDTALYRSNVIAIHNQLVRVHGFTLTAPDSANIVLVYNTFFRYGPAITYGSRAGSEPITAVTSSSAATFSSLTIVTDTSGTARSFLASDANYQFVRGLHSRNLIIPVVGDFGGPKALRRVGDYLRETGTIVNAHYTSNVEAYLFVPPGRGGTPVWREYYTSVGFLPLDSSSVFIRPNGLRVTPDKVLRLLDGLQPPLLTPGVAQPPARGTAPSPPAPQSPSLGSITGTVSDSATGVPIANAYVGLDGSGRPAVRTDNNGKYTIPNVAAGTYSLSSSSAGNGQVIAWDVVVTAGAVTVLNFQSFPRPISVPGARGGRAASIPPPPGVTICPMLAYLAAFRGGRVQSNVDATRCVR